MKLYFKFVYGIHNWSTRQMTYSFRKLYPKYPITFNEGKNENLSSQHR